MANEAFKEALQQLGFKQAEFARHIGYHRRMVNRWASGDWPVPLVVARLIEAYKGQMGRVPTGQHLGED